MGLVPKLSVGGVKNVVTAEPVLAVGTAILFGTTAAGFISKFIAKIPLLGDHITFALIGLSVVILLVAIKMKSGVFKAIVIGLAGGSLFIGLLQVDFVQQSLGEVARIVGR